MNQEATIKKKKPLFLVWIIPLIAMALAGWMIFKHYDNKGFEVIVTFDSGDGIAVGKTPLMYNGIKIGVVTGMDIHHTDISKIDVTITVDKTATGVNREGNVFWKVEPTLSLTEVSGLSTILGGIYIGVMPSKKTPQELNKLAIQNHFKASKEEPVNIFNPGRYIKLKAQDSDIQEGAPILYKNINIGKVIDISLKDNYIEYRLYMKEKFNYLLKDTSQFYKISGVEVRASLSGLRIQMDSLASVIAGGIAITSPNNGDIVQEDGKSYQLYEDINELDLNKDILTLVSDNGYNIDTKSTHIYFKGSDAGKVLSLDYDPDKDTTTFKIKLKSEFRHLANNDAYFWIVQPKVGLTSIEGLGAFATGNYINFATSTKSKKLKTNFKLHQNSPQIKGKYFSLTAKDSFNLKSGVNIIHKDIIIGALSSFKLAKNKHDVIFDVIIAPKYKHLVNDSSNFYIKGAVEMGASFDGAFLNIGSITSMVNGGIVLKTENFDVDYNEQTFTLHDSYKNLKDSLYLQDGGKYFTLTTLEMNSIKVNSPILYKGIKVGKIVSYELNEQTKQVDLKIYIKKSYADLVNKSTNFYNISGIQVKASLDGLKLQTGSLESIITGGIAFKTPIKSNEVQNLHQFTLYADEDAVDEKYVSIHFTVNEDSGLSKGAKIVYKSIQIGEVKELKLVDDEVIIETLIKQEHQNLLVKDTLFWIENVKIDIGSVKNPSSILTGAFIKLRKGHSDISSTNYELANTTPVETLTKEGLRVLVKGDRLGSLEIASPIFYRQIKIGSVESVKLSDDAKGVELKLYINKCYSYLVRENSIFYNAGAIGVDVSLFGVKVSTETISTMIQGGINLVTPNDIQSKAQNMQKFKLHVAPEEEWLEYSPELINNDESCTN